MAAVIAPLTQRRAWKALQTHYEKARELAASFPETASREGFLLAAEYAANRRK